MHSVFNFAFKLHLYFLFHFIFAENRRILVCKLLGEKPNLFCKLNLLPQYLVYLQFAFQSSFLVVHRPLQATIKEQCDFPLLQTRKENHQQLEMKPHVAMQPCAVILRSLADSRFAPKRRLQIFYIKVTAMRTLYLSVQKIVFTRVSLLVNGGTQYLWST